MLLRTVLSRYTPVSPSAWAFASDERGKPGIAGPAAQALCFSLTHTPGLVCCAVTTHLSVGVDAECIDRPLDVDAIACRCLSPDERQQLDSPADPAQRLRFFEYWTLKESLAKALGVGLSVDFSRFSFRLGNGAIRVSLDGGGSEDCAWQFHVSRPTPSHVLAVAVRKPDGAAVHLRTHTVSLEELQ